jgi:hypothetical protein
MKQLIHNANSILGIELVNVFRETYGHDENELREIINEAIRALSIVRRNRDWNNIQLPYDQE